MPSDKEIDEMCTVLKNSRRRNAMHVLADRGRIDKSELVTRVTELEHDAPIDELDRSTDRHNVYVALQQRHLDVLEDAGVIRRSGNTIMKGDRFDDVYRMIRPEKSITARIKQSISAFRSGQSAD